MYPIKDCIERYKKKERNNKGICKEDIGVLNPSTITEKVPNHCFGIWQIQLSVNIFYKTHCGFRGIASCYKELHLFINIDTVSYGCIRQWILRLGLGLLQEPIEKRNDWIYIIDFSIQLGRERCLLILGVTRQSLVENGYELTYKQVRVLDIYVREHFEGELVYERLNTTMQKTGKPYQIISDAGNDVRKGIELSCTENKSIIPTYDITHMIGVVLKSYLEKDERWLSLQEDLLSVTQQVKQTEMSFSSTNSIEQKGKMVKYQQRNRVDGRYL